jgi:hypothetical protein
LEPPDLEELLVVLELAVEAAQRHMVTGGVAVAPMMAADLEPQAVPLQSIPAAGEVVVVDQIAGRLLQGQPGVVDSVS